MPNETDWHHKNDSANPKEWGTGGRNDQWIERQIENKYIYKCICDLRIILDANDLNIPIERDSQNMI